MSGRRPNDVSKIGKPDGLPIWSPETVQHPEREPVETPNEQPIPVTNWPRPKEEPARKSD